MSRTIVIDSHGVPSRPMFTMDENSDVELVYDFGLFFPADGTLTCTASTESGGLTVDTPSVSGKKATIGVSGSATGCHQLEVKGTLGNETWQVVTTIKITDYTAPIADGGDDYGRWW